MRIYTDGSFKDGLFGWAFVVVENDHFVHQEYGELTAEELGDNASSRNVTSELIAARKALEWAAQKGYKKVTLFYDYEGVAKWIDGSWRAKKPLTKEWHRFVHDLPFDVEFIHVKGHSDDKWNEMADSLASVA